MPGTAAEDLRFEILGPLRARRGDEVLELGPGKQRAVLAILLVAANRAVPPAKIVDAVWGDEPPENGTNVVQKYVAGLRRVLEPGRTPRSGGQLLALTAGGYLLSVAPGSTDADDFAATVDRAHELRTAGRLEEAAGEFQAALALWRADALAGVDGPIFDAARERLAEGRAAALEAWTETELDLGRHARLVPELARLVEEFPLRERLRAVQMLALYRSGRQAEALAVFRDIRSLLVAEHGVEPGEELRQLHARVLRNDPTLLRDPAPGEPDAQPEAAVAETTRAWWQHPWLLRSAAAAIPLVTFGLGTWALMAVLATRRRRLVLGLAAAAYLGLAIAALMLIDTTADDLGAVSMLAAMFGGSLHAALIVPAGPTRRRTRDLAAEVRRRQARDIAEHHPDIARRLGIGRPDLPRRFDDGGLIDLNEAPVEVLATLPGLSPQQAALIAADRSHRGLFRSLDDAMGRGLFPDPLPTRLADLLVVISVQDTVGGGRQNP